MLLPASPLGLLSPALFLFPHLELSPRMRSIVVGCDSQGVEARAASASALVPGINKVGARFYCPQRILTGAGCSKAESINQWGRMLGIWRQILNKGTKTSKKGEYIGSKRMVVLCCTAGTLRHASRTLLGAADQPSKTQGRCWLAAQPEPCSVTAQQCEQHSLLLFHYCLQLDFSS